eukprot:g7268.t1
MPVSPILPLRLEDNVESKFADLPQDVIINIMNRLETVEIYHFTLVCKNWRAVVYNNPQELRRAEHTIEKHLITYTRWMDRQAPTSLLRDDHRYPEFCWYLFKWYCNLSQNLETLILSDDLPSCRPEELLQLCPRLKSLEIGHRLSLSRSTDQNLINSFNFSNLEFFCHEWDILFNKTELNEKVLVSSDRLRAFKGILCMDNIHFITLEKPLESVFGRLIALDLCFIEVEVLEMLLEVESWQLRYFRIHDGKQMSYSKSTRLRARMAFEKLLLKLNQLEILISCQRLITNRSIELMIELNLNLRFAVFFLTGSVLTNNNKEPIDLGTLIAFRDALLFRCPDLDLSEIRFVMNYDDKRHLNLVEADTGFTFITLNTLSYSFCNRCNYSLRHPKIKQYLGLDF